MTLNEWAEEKRFSDRQVADLMTQWIEENEPTPEQVSVQSVQKYRTGRVPKGARMRAIFAISGGWVTANDFFDLPVVM